MLQDLSQKVKEIDSKITELGKLDSSEKARKSETLGMELSELVYVAFILAEYHNIELEDIFLQTVNDRMIALL